MLALYAFHDDTQFWADYFYVMHAYAGVLGFAYNLKKEKTHKEMTAITFFLVYRVLLLIYFILFGMILGYAQGMAEWLMTLIIFGVSSYVGLLYWNKKKDYERL